CRHHRGLVASRAPRKSIDAREADAIDDDLLDNPLNDINEEYGSHTRPAKVRKANEDAEKSQTTKDRIREGQAQDGATNFQALKSSLGQRVQSYEDVASLEGGGVEQADQRGAKFDKIVAELRNEVPGSGEDAMASNNLEARKDANSRISKFLASGFEELKKNLASRVEEPAGQLREERPEQHENASEVQDETHAKAVHEPSDEGPEDEGRESKPTSRSLETKLDKLRARKKARREAQKEARKARQLQAAQKSQSQNPNNKPSQEANEKPAQEPTNTPDDSTAVGEVTEQHQESEPLQSTLPPAAPTKIESTDINSLNASELVVNA
ncbi:hypothetical protein KC352_g36914, partial [Hortaea werneckii]